MKLTLREQDNGFNHKLKSLDANIIVSVVRHNSRADFKKPLLTPIRFVDNGESIPVYRVQLTVAMKCEFYLLHAHNFPSRRMSNEVTIRNTKTNFPFNFFPFRYFHSTYLIPKVNLKIKLSIHL